MLELAIIMSFFPISLPSNLVGYCFFLFWQQKLSRFSSNLHQLEMHARWSLCNPTYTELLTHHHILDPTTFGHGSMMMMMMMMQVNFLCSKPPCHQIV
jgi:hypothetical protein